MKHIIEFNLPEERNELALHMQAGDMASFLWSWEQDFLRSSTKYSPSEEFTGAVNAERNDLAELSNEQIQLVLEAVKWQYYKMKSEYKIDNE